jgi:hypothetical protein
MLTTGLGQAHESIPRGPRGVGAPSQAAQGPSADRTATLAPTDCPVCGDVEAEPIAVCSDFERPAARTAFIALRCSDCGIVYLSPASSTDRPLRSVVVPDGLSRVGRRIAQSADPTRILALSEQGKVSIDPIQLGRGSLQLVILDGTLEYSQSPQVLLTALREALHPDGHVVLILRNLISPSFAVFGGRHWAGYDVPGQRALYSMEGIRRLARRVGFEVRSMSTVSDPACWVESCRRALADWRAPAWLVRRFANTSTASLVAFGLLERILQWRRKGGILVVSLRKASDG